MPHLQQSFTQARRDFSAAGSFSSLKELRNEQSHFLAPPVECPFFFLLFLAEEVQTRNAVEPALSCISRAQAVSFDRQLEDSRQDICRIKSLAALLGTYRWMFASSIVGSVSSVPVKPRTGQLCPGVLYISDYLMLNC